MLSSHLKQMFAIDKDYQFNFIILINLFSQSLGFILSSYPTMLVPPRDDILGDNRINAANLDLITFRNPFLTF